MFTLPRQYQRRRGLTHHSVSGRVGMVAAFVGVLTSALILVYRPEPLVRVPLLLSRAPANTRGRYLDLRQVLHRRRHLRRASRLLRLG